MQYVAVSALSHDGRVRDHNEDSLVVGPWTLCAATTLTPQTIYLPIGAPVVVAVADGLGAHPAGEEARSLAVRWLARAAPSLIDEASIREALNVCNEVVYADAAPYPERTTMGTGPERRDARLPRPGQRSANLAVPRGGGLSTVDALSGSESGE